MQYKFFKLLNFFIILSILSGCATSSKNRLLGLDDDKTQLELRMMQSRNFENQAKADLLRSAIATLQDLDFVLDKADETTGIVSARKFTKGQVCKITVNVRENYREHNKSTVRVNAEYGLNRVEDPTIYQSFFAALDKNVFHDKC